MKFKHKISIACIVVLLPFLMAAQSYALDAYKLDPSKKTWIQKIKTFPKVSTSSWHQPRVKSAGMMDGKASYAKFKRAFPELNTAEKYIAVAVMFKTKRPSGTQKKHLKNKNLVQYHAPSNVFAAYDSKGKPITFFRPKEGQKYYDNIGKNTAYTFPGYVPYKSSSSRGSTASNSNPLSSSKPRSSSSNNNSRGSSSNRDSNANAPHKHTREYFLKSYRPKPGVKTWVNSASKFSKKSTKEWHAKEHISASNNAKEKYNKHRNAFPEIKSLTEYIATAHQFKAKRPSGTLKKKMKNGDTVQYHEDTNVFAAYNTAGMPRTMFRPKAGILYYEDLESVKQIQYDGYGEREPSRHASSSASSSSKPGSSSSSTTITDSGEVIRSSKNQLVNIALQATSIENKLNRSLNSKKSWDAVKQILVEANIIYSKDTRTINASTQLVNSGDPLISGWKNIPEGHLIGFFAPTNSAPTDVKGPAPSKKEKLIHLMVSSGNARAIGTGNKTIGIGDLRGWQELDLSSLNYNNQQKFFVKGQGRSATEIYVRTYDPKKGFKNRAIDNPTTNIGGVQGDKEKRLTGENSSTTSTKKSSNQLLSEIAISSTKMNTAENRVLNTKKAKAAVEHVLKLSNQKNELDLRRLYRDLNTTNIAPQIVDDINALPAGYVLRFFKPSSPGVQQIQGHTFSKKVKEIHTMITTGNGKAIGTENQNIGIGSIRGWEELDLKRLLRYNRELRYFELIKNNERIEVYITFDNPFGPVDKKYQNEWDGSENHTVNRSLDDIVNEYEGNSDSEYDVSEPPANYNNKGSVANQSNTLPNRNSVQDDNNEATSSSSSSRPNPRRVTDSNNSPSESTLRRVNKIGVYDDNDEPVYERLPDNSFIDPNAGRRISDVALELLNTKDPKKKAIGFKKSWDAIEHMLVLSDVISNAKAKKMVAIKELIEPSDPKAKRLQSLPPGTLIGFFAPLPNGQERMVHSLVAIGNGQAVGTGNSAIGAGSTKGLEALDLASLNMSSNSTISKKQGSKTMEIIVRVNNPIEFSDTGLFDDDGITNEHVYEEPDVNASAPRQASSYYEEPDANTIAPSQASSYYEESNSNAAASNSSEASENLYTAGPAEQSSNPYTAGPAASAPRRSSAPSYELQNNSSTNTDPSIWKSGFGLSSEELAKRYYNQAKSAFPSAKNVEEYTALAMQYYEDPPANSMHRVMSNGDNLFYSDEYEIFAAYTKTGNPIQFTRPKSKFFYFWKYAYQAVCDTNGSKSEALDSSLPPSGLKGRLRNVYKTIDLPSEYDGENLGLRPENKGSHVEYCSISERQALEVFVKNGLLVDRHGKLIDTRGASRALSTAPPHMAIFVMDTNGRIYQFKYPFATKFHHSSFLAGAAVAAAGEIQIFDGEIKRISARSGHYKPTTAHVRQALRELQQRGYNGYIPASATPCSFRPYGHPGYRLCWLLPLSRLAHKNSKWLVRFDLFVIARSLIFPILEINFYFLMIGSAIF